MHPLLYEGKGYVLLAPITGELSVGDIPIFQRADGKYVLHRLVKIEGDFCYTRGDNCVGMEQVPRDAMLGVVTEIVQNGKTIRVTDPGYRRYVSLWMRLAPVRIPLYHLRAKLWGAANKLQLGFKRG